MTKRNGNGSGKSTALATFKPADHPLLNLDPTDFKEMVLENMGAAGLSEFDLDRIKIPSGGALQFELTDEDGKPTYTQEILGVVLAKRDVRVYWERGFDEGGGTPPDCHSTDLITGVGNPGGACHSCPFAKFNTAKKGSGQACQQRRLMFIAMPGSLLPALFNLPPTALTPARKYAFRLLNREQPRALSSVITRITLETDKSSKGVDYARPVFSIAEVLSDEDAAKFKAIGEALAPQLERIRVEAGSEEVT